LTRASRARSNNEGEFLSSSLGSALDVDDEVRSRACLGLGAWGWTKQQPAPAHQQPTNQPQPRPIGGPPLSELSSGGHQGHGSPLQGSGEANKERHSRPTPTTAGFGAGSQSARTGSTASPANPDLPPAPELLVLSLASVNHGFCCPRDAVHDGCHPSTEKSGLFGVPCHHGPILAFSASFPASTRGLHRAAQMHGEQ